MPSLAHHGLVDLFREQPSLAPELLARVHGIELPAGVRYQLGDTNLDRLRPAERRADLVLELRRGGRPLLIVLLEVQRRVDPRKRIAWIEYLVSARRRGRACVLVVTTSARVAAWAARPFDLGPGNDSLHVWVLGPGHIQPVTDASAARATPALALLSALVHAKREPAAIAAAVACLPGLSEELAELYYNLLSEHLPPRLRPYLEHQMLNIADYNLPPSPLFQDLERLADDVGPDLFFNMVKKQLNVEARKEVDKLAPELTHRLARKALKNLAKKVAKDFPETPSAACIKGVAKGLSAEIVQATRLNTDRKRLLRLMHKAGFNISEAQRRRVECCVDARELDRWTDRLFTAESTREIFAAPKKQVARRRAARKPTAKKQSAASSRTRRS